MRHLLIFLIIEIAVGLSVFNKQTVNEDLIEPLRQSIKRQNNTTINENDFLVNVPESTKQENSTKHDENVPMLNMTESKNVSQHQDKHVEVPEFNLRPIIGILAQEKSKGMRRAYKDNTTTSYIAASYVKYIESAGARVVPIMINQPYDYYVNLSKSLNGVLFPGGSASITNTSGYGQAGQYLYDLVVSANPPLPLWGTCLGFEMLMYLGANQVRPLTPCKARNRADPLILQPDWADSDLLGTAPEEVIDNAVTENTTSNFHKYCVLPQNFSTNLGLNESFLLLSTSFDDDQLEYISTVEHRDLPIYGTQWHPEKVAFEWVSSDKYHSIPHTEKALAVSQYMANFFVSKARENHNSFKDEEEETKYLIYNFKPEYSAVEYSSSFQQIYLFDN